MYGKVFGDVFVIKVENNDVNVVKVLPFFVVVLLNLIERIERFIKLIN